MKKLTFHLLLATLITTSISYAQNFPIIGTILGGQTKNLVSSGLTDNMNLSIKNTGLVPLQFFMAGSATATASPNQGITVTAGQSIQATVAQLGGVTGNSYLNVTNLNLTLAGLFNVDKGPSLTDVPSLCGITNTTGSAPNVVATWIYDINKIYMCPLWGNLGLGTSTPAYPLDVVGSARFSGTVGIGTNPPSQFKLAVEGTIGAREVQVIAGNFPDYVFEKDYNLRSLKELEIYIHENKHLPNIPSAKQVEENKGVKLGELNTKMLEKIEELTLYVIEQNKKIEEQSKTLSAQQKQIDELLNKNEKTK